MGDAECNKEVQLVTIRRDVKLQVSGTTELVIFDSDVRQKAEFTIDEAPNRMKHKI